MTRPRVSVWITLAASLANGLVAVAVTNFSRSCGSEPSVPSWGFIPFVAALILAIAAVGVASRIRAFPEVILGVALIVGCFLLYGEWVAIGLADPCQSGH
jgi:hypothetical protein